MQWTEKVANQIAWTPGISTKYNRLAKIMHYVLPHNYGGLDILLTPTAFYSHRITQLITYLSGPTQILLPAPEAHTKTGKEKMPKPNIQK